MNEEAKRLQIVDELAGYLRAMMSARGIPRSNFDDLMQELRVFVLTKGTFRSAKKFRSYVARVIYFMTHTWGHRESPHERRAIPLTDLVRGHKTHTDLLDSLPGNYQEFNELPERELGPDFEARVRAFLQELAPGIDEIAALNLGLLNDSRDHLRARLAIGNSTMRKLWIEEIQPALQLHFWSERPSSWEDRIPPKLPAAPRRAGGQ